MRISNARMVHAKMVAASSGIVQFAKYIVEHPVDFVISTATSAATFMAVKRLIGITVGAFFPALGFGLAAAMLASGVIAIGRGMGEEVKKRRRRVEALYQSDTPPTHAELAEARNINMSAVIETGVKRALFSGLLSGLTGAVIGTLGSDWVEHRHAAQHASSIPTDPEYQRFLEAIADHESRNSGLYQAENGLSFIGKYQFGEEALYETGYYDWVDAKGNKVDLTDWQEGKENAWTRRNTWEGHWKGLDGVYSKEDFMNNPTAQENAIRKLLARNWREIVQKDLDDYVGQTINGIKITESGLLGGAHLGGVGGVRDFLTGVHDNSDGAARVSGYVRELGGYTVPFEVDNPNQIPFGLMYEVTPAIMGPQSSISFISPIPADTSVQYISDTFGWRTDHPVHHDQRMHWGIDIAAVHGTPVLATAEGEVVAAGYGKGIGNQVIIEHPDGTRTRYGHLSSIGVKVGQELPQGFKVGEVGSTGTATGNHLHYEIKTAAGQTINPMPYLPKLGSRGFTR